MLKVLDLFDLEHPEWSFDAIFERLNYSRATLYRYLKTLTDAGLLSSFPGRSYTLGPRIIELDYQIVMTDPLIHAAKPVMRELVSSFAGVTLLCRRYRDRVLCVHQESSNAQLRSKYERGRARPLLVGSASLVILANLSAYQLARLYEKDPEAFGTAGLGHTLAEVKEEMKRIRQRGWAKGEGQLTPGVTGVGAPIFDAHRDIIGSLNLTLPETGIPDDRIEEIGDRLRFCAGIITKSLQ